MIFEALNDAAERGELILVDGGLCDWHLRRDGQITIREIIILPKRRGQGIGTAMFDALKVVPGATNIFAKCPADLEANGWYQHLGFTNEGVETTRAGRQLRLWRFRF